MQHLLSISTTITFVEGVMCAIHPQHYAFSMIEDDNIKVDEPVACDCSNLLKTVKVSKLVGTLEIHPELGRIQIDKPYELIDIIEPMDEESIIEESERRFHFIKDVESRGISETIEHKGESKNLFRFQIENQLFNEMLEQIGESCSLEMTISDKMELKTIAEKPKIIRYPNVSSPEEIKFLITEDCSPIIKSALINSEKEDVKGNSTISIIDESFMIISNIAKTMISAAVS